MTKIDTGSTIDLRWNAAACWSCGLCRDVCPSGALRNGEGVRVPAFVAKSDATLVSGVGITCAECGGRFVRRLGESVCPRCREDRRQGICRASLFGLGRPTLHSVPGTSQAIQGGSEQ